uniref:DUF2281 domain-containing protein n=1 Tax=Candidatus Kentrum sp. FW TaxID=2126338 RepID=A0A450TE61_9GAMM|nr:MAG: hypothetical protein BECKFW1821B_GA0114236_110213 [Candidatus Kentron sp. FW]
MNQEMSQEGLLRNIADLPPVARQEAIDFIAFLKFRHGRQPVEKITDDLSDLRNEAFVGIWKDRSDMADSTAWVKNLRKKEWG